MLYSISNSFLPVQHRNKHVIYQKYDRYGQLIPFDVLWNVFTYCIEKDSSVDKLVRVCRNWKKVITSHEFTLYLLQINRKVSLQPIKALTFHVECKPSLLRFGWNSICDAQLLRIQNAPPDFRDHFRSGISLATSRILKCADWVGTLSNKEASYISFIKLNFSRDIKNVTRYEQIVRILKYLPNLRKLDLDAFDFNLKQIRKIITLCPNITDLHLTVNFDLNAAIFRTLLPLAKQLYRLCIKAYPIPWYLGSNLSDISYFMDRTSSLRYLSLERSLASGSWFDTCIMRNRRLAHISLMNASLNDACCIRLATVCKELNTLEINIRPPLTNHGIISILRQCTQLSHLTLQENKRNSHIDATILEIIEEEALSLRTLKIIYAREKVYGERVPLEIDAIKNERFKMSRPDLKITYTPPHPPSPLPPSPIAREGGPLR